MPPIFYKDSASRKQRQVYSIYVEAPPIFYKDSANREQRDQTCLKSSVKSKRLGRTAQNILDPIISDGSIFQDKITEKVGVSKRAIEMQIANLKAKGLLISWWLLAHCN